MPFSDLLAGRVPASRLRGQDRRGRRDRPRSQDVYATPVGGGHAGAEIQAHAIDTIRRDFPLRQRPGWPPRCSSRSPGWRCRWPPCASTGLAGCPWPAAARRWRVAAALAFNGGQIVPVAAPLAALVVGFLATLAVA